MTLPPLNANFLTEVLRGLGFDSVFEQPTQGGDMKTCMTILITAILTSLCWMAVFAGVVYFYFSSPPPFQVRVDYPNRVAMGDSFPLVVHISNPSERTETLDSIDIYDSLLSGFEIESVTPVEDSRDRILNFHSFCFSYLLDSATETEIVFTLKAQQKGYFGGDIDVCTPWQSFTTVSAGIVVE